MFDEQFWTDMRNTHMGWCTHCNDWTRDCTEPDATNYDCPVCQNNSVVGADTYLIELI